MQTGAMNSIGTPFSLVAHAYIDGAFVEPHGTELADLFNPSTEDRIGQVRLGDREDALRAIAAAKRAFAAMSRTSKSERIAMLDRLHAAVSARVDDIRDAMMREYGASRASPPHPPPTPPTRSGARPSRWRTTT